MSIASSRFDAGSSGGMAPPTAPSSFSAPTAPAAPPSATSAGATDAVGAQAKVANPLALFGRVVLVATDGSEGAIAGIHLAAALARRYQALVHVVSVVDTRPAFLSPPLDLALVLGGATSTPEWQDRHVEEVQASLTAATRQTVDWPIHIRLGSPARTIATEAERIGAALVIVGLRRHGRLDRLVNDETALNVMREAPCPVIGVVPGSAALPRRVLAAVDFSESSLLAARAASAIVGDDATLLLAYVPPLTAFLPGEGERIIHDLGVQAGFARAIRELGSVGITFDHVVLHHDLARSASEVLIRYAEQAGADLIAVGSGRHTRFDRWMMGSVSTDLVREGRRSILVVPPTATSR